ncbi:putative WRKY transcription factor 4 [Vitis vinifera]|uniref:Putative WRKY transcription factor 4 n=1 Tax=Vitis vinifera TaxID=29760 RepID=A0A438GC31_VITVI|nr:putative WRKY transcription factor 4 [Vitis vinifera]
MAKNDETSLSSSASASRASAPLRPTITLPPRSSMETLFPGGPGFSPGPMTLVSNFFSDNDPDSDCRSFSQLLAGAMASPAAVPGPRPSFSTDPQVSASSKEDRTSVDAAGDFEFRFKQNRPSGLVIAQSPLFTVPPGLSPTCLLDSPGFFSQLLKAHLASIVSHFALLVAEKSWLGRKVYSWSELGVVGSKYQELRRKREKDFESRKEVHLITEDKGQAIALELGWIITLHK